MSDQPQVNVPDGADALQRMVQSQQRVRAMLGLVGSGPLSIEEMIDGQREAAKTAILSALGDLGGTRSGTNWESRWYEAGQTHKRDLPSFAHHTITRDCWTDETARDLAVTAWMLPEWPEQIGREEWDETFEAAGGLPLTDHDGPGLPDQPVQVWRGAYEEHRHGLAWTTDPGTAMWFAARANRPGDPDRRAQVWTATVTPDRVYAHLTGRGEDEVVCAVEGLPVTVDADHAIPEAATAYDQSNGQFWIECSGCGQRHYGHRGAAGLLLRHTPQDGPPQVWLARRGRGTDHAGTWAYPSGALNPGEGPLAAALREFTEETSFDTGRLPEPAHEVVNDHGPWAFTAYVVDVDEDTALAVDRAADGDGESVEGAWWTVDEAHQLSLLPPVADFLRDLHPAG